ncbi:MAG: hypothetical protein GX660_11650 [Clostridiaceae bacterium]|nr:hypothetical protein [Clostridiaceae bacterium]
MNNPIRLFCIVMAAVMVIVSGGAVVLASSFDMLFNIYTVSNTSADTLYGTVPVEFNTMIYGQSADELKYAKISSVEIYDRYDKLIHKEFYLHKTSEIEEGSSIQYPYYVSDRIIADFEYGQKYQAYIEVNKNGKKIREYREFDVKPSLTSPTNINLEISDMGNNAYDLTWSGVPGADGYVIYANDSDGIYFGGSNNNNYCVSVTKPDYFLDFEQLRALFGLRKSFNAYIYVAAYSSNGYFKVVGRSEVKRVYISEYSGYSSLNAADISISTSENSGVSGEYDNVSVLDVKEEPGVQIKEVFINGDMMTGFLPEIRNYTIILPGGTKNVPVVNASPLDEGCSVYISNTDVLPGTTRIRVNSHDGNKAGEYELNFMVAKGRPGLLSSITLSQGILSPPFQPEISSYSVILPQGNNVPGISAVPSDGNSVVELIQAGQVPGKALINVKSEEGSLLNTYSLNYKLSGGNSISMELVITVVSSVTAVFAAIMSIIFYRRMKKFKSRIDESKNK